MAQRRPLQNFNVAFRLDGLTKTYGNRYARVSCPYGQKTNWRHVRNQTGSLPFLLLCCKLAYYMPFSGKFRSVITVARFAQPPQYIHRNERLGRESAAITFLSDTCYHGDIIRKQRCLQKKKKQKLCRHITLAYFCLAT